MSNHVITRRRHKRFKVKDGAFAVLIPDSSKLGKIIDISMGGFSCRYSDSQFIDNDRNALAFLYNDCQKRLEEFSEFDIFLVDSGIYIERIPCKIISSLEIDDKNSSSSVSMKRCSIQFEALTPKQISGLEYFIKHCTKGEV